MKIYISLPISGRPIQEAREEADLTAAMISRSGHTPVNPFLITAGANPKYEDYLCADIRALLDCDAIYQCDGWQLSTGCNIEFSVVVYINQKRRRDGQSEIKIYSAGSFDKES